MMKSTVGANTLGCISFNVVPPDSPLTDRLLMGDYTSSSLRIGIA